MGLIKYLKRKMALLSLALSRVEKSSLNQMSDALGEEGSANETMNQGSMADALLRGEITMPVKELRWRLYKVLEASKGQTAKVTGYDDDGLPIVETYSVEKYKLDKIRRDDFDSYPVELSIKNEDIVESTADAFGNTKLNVHSEEEIENFNETNKMFDLVKMNTIIDEYGNEIEMEEEKEDNRTLGNISFDDMVSSMKSKKSIYVEREQRPKFEIEQYAKKLMVRKINDNERLLEFYISLYPDTYDRKTRMLIADIKKAIKNPRISDLLDIKKVEFITSKTIGAADGLVFVYQIKHFDKIVEFNGHYVIKFVADVVINGENIFDKYKLDELEERYKNKEAKNL
jgi:hypothetical protein